MQPEEEVVIEEKKTELPQADSAVLFTPPGLQLKRYPGLKAFKNQEAGRYPSLKTKGGRLSKLVLYSEGQEVAVYDYDRSATVETIRGHLSAHGIEPSAKRRF